MQFLRIDDAGVRTLAYHPGWRVGETPQEARLCTNQELLDMGYGLEIVDKIPEYDATTTQLNVAPIETWPVDKSKAYKRYTLTALPVPTIEEVRAAMPSLTRSQLLLVLYDIGVYEAHVDAALANDPEAMIVWKNAASYERMHPLVVSMGPLFQLKPEQIDDLWRYAGTIAYPR